MPTTGTTTPERKNLVTYNFWNQDGDIKEQYGHSANGSTVLCELDYADSGAFLRDMLGYSERNGNDINRVLPEKSGWDEDQVCLQCDLVKALTYTGLAADESEWPEFTRVVYACTFGAPLYRIYEDGEIDNEHERYVIWKIRGAANNEKIPGGGFKFIDAAKSPIGEVGVKTGRLTMLTAKWIDVPFLSTSIYTAAANRINTSAVTWNGSTYAAETVLFESWDADERRNPFGEFTYDITFNFAIRADGRTWNKFWKNGTGGYVEVSSDGTSGGDKPFATYDLNDLFTIG
jgi:hypothetical protein